ncbi:MAG: 4-(cytidine 5'-diphospho)-2-C-methyl-D-erythritol kinase [Pyrinomonadaceae bacterium]
MNESRIKLPSFAKINWFLHVLGKRDDDFHEICTAFQTVSLSDTISFDEFDGFSLTSNDPAIPTGDENLIIRSARQLAKKFGVKKGVRIHLEKNIPFPGGLGGGSSNAAITLLALSSLWNLQADIKDLCEIGSEIGADVPFFLRGGTALGKGRGTEISALEDIEEKYIIIATPSVNIDTAKAYARLAARRLTKNDSKSILQNCCEIVQRLESGRLELFNDFENTVISEHPEIGRLKIKLLEMGAKKALLSGSGASVYGVFDNESKRQSAFDSFADEQGIKKFAVETISRREYMRSLGPCKHMLQNSF